MKRKSKSHCKKRILSDDHIAKMQEGRKNAKKLRDENQKTKERVDMLSDLDERLAIGRKNASSDGIRIKTKRCRKRW